MTFIEFDDFCRICVDWNYEKMNEEMIIHDLNQRFEGDSLSEQNTKHRGITENNELTYETRDKILL